MIGPVGLWGVPRSRESARAGRRRSGAVAGPEASPRSRPRHARARRASRRSDGPQIPHAVPGLASGRGHHEAEHGLGKPEPRRAGGRARADGPAKGHDRTQARRGRTGPGRRGRAGGLAGSAAWADDGSGRFALARRTGERRQRPHRQVGPDAPLDGRELEPALGERAIVAEQAIDDGMRQGDLQAQRQACALAGQRNWAIKPGRRRPEARQSISGGPSSIGGRSRGSASRARQDRGGGPPGDPLLETDLPGRKTGQPRPEVDGALLVARSWGGVWCGIVVNGHGPPSWAHRGIDGRCDVPGRAGATPT